MQVLTVIMPSLEPTVLLKFVNSPKSSVFSSSAQLVSASLVEFVAALATMTRDKLLAVPMLHLSLESLAQSNLVSSSSETEKETGRMSQLHEVQNEATTLNVYTQLYTAAVLALWDWAKDNSGTLLVLS